MIMRMPENRVAAQRCIVRCSSDFEFRQLTALIASARRQSKRQIGVNLIVLGSQIGDRELVDDHFV